MQSGPRAWISLMALLVSCSATVAHASSACGLQMDATGDQAGSAEAQRKAPVQFQLLAGKPLHEQISAWANTTGWRLLWRAPTNWLVTNTVDMGTCDMLESIEKLVGWLNEEGASIRFIAYQGNMVLVAESLAMMSEK